MELPESLDWWRSVPGGAGWLERVPRLAAECAEEWQLRLGLPLIGGNAALVLAAESSDGRPVVLKLNFPDAESEHEPDALEFWGGVGAVRLLARDDQRRALLLERCLPGTRLWAIADEVEANQIACRVLRRLWRPAPPEIPFRTLAQEARRWVEQLPQDWSLLGRPFDRRLIDLAVQAARETWRSHRKRS